MIKKNIIKVNFSINNFLNNKINKKLFLKYTKVKESILKDINNPKSIYNILNENYNFNFKLKDLKKFNNFRNIVIIGMGGSILGSEAIYYFLRHRVQKNLFFFNNLNSEEITKFRRKNLKNILYIVISKSGNTLETLTNLVALRIVKKDKKNIILISEKKNNILFNVSKKFKLFFIEHKRHIGGRYSVLSEVGMIPAYLMGLSPFRIRKNLKKSIIGVNKSDLLDGSTKLANIFLNKKYSSIVLLNYIPQLEKFLLWYQQLLAESLGKKGRGLLPTVSTAPKDHHSLLQLYLDGPKDKIFYIFGRDEKNTTKLYFSNLESQIKYLNNKSIESIKAAQKKALIQSLKNKKIPFREFKVNEINEETIGELFSYFILETSIIGKLISINPFNQPAVEEVKIHTKKFLK